MVDATLVERYRSARKDPALAVLEGLHALKHALRFGAAVMDVRTRDPSALAALGRELAPDVAARIEERAEPVADDAFDRLAPAPHPTGVIALAERPAVRVSELLARPGPAPIVLLERPTHHGNIGAVVRVAAAAGAAAVLVTGPHDPWHPASIRGGAGLQFALPVTALDGDGLGAVLASDRPVVVLDPEGDALVRPDPGPAAEREARWPIPAGAVLVFGSERTGVSDRLVAGAEARVAIPMRQGVSSLNLATAVAVTLYAAGGATAF